MPYIKISTEKNEIQHAGRKTYKVCARTLFSIILLCHTWLHFMFQVHMLEQKLANMTANLKFLKADQLKRPRNKSRYEEQRRSSLVD
jgi:hypothetical protein